MLKKLYEAMKTFCLLDSKSKEAMGLAGRQLAEKVFDEQKILRQYTDIFSEI